MILKDLPCPALIKIYKTPEPFRDNLVSVLIKEPSRDDSNNGHHTRSVPTTFIQSTSCILNTPIVPRIHTSYNRASNP